MRRTAIFDHQGTPTVTCDSLCKGFDVLCLDCRPPPGLEVKTSNRSEALRANTEEEEEEEEEETDRYM